MKNNVPALGQRWISDAEPELGLGVVIEVDARAMTVLFPRSEETRVYARANAPLTRIHFGAGDRIEDAGGRLLARTEPAVAGRNAAQAIDPRNAYIISNMLKDVVRYGTANRATALGRGDISGKTGTTNNFRDAWFAGFTPSLVAVTWVGFDQPRSLGRYGYGGTAALPIWINYMNNALKGVPDIELPPPPGIVVRPGAALRGNDEYYMEEFQRTNPQLSINNRGTVPGSGNVTPDETAPAEEAAPAGDAVENVKELLF